MSRAFRREQTKAGMRPSRKPTTRAVPNVVHPGRTGRTALVVDSFSSDGIPRPGWNSFLLWKPPGKHCWTTMTPQRPMNVSWRRPVASAGWTWLRHIIGPAQPRTRMIPWPSASSTVSPPWCSSKHWCPGRDPSWSAPRLSGSCGWCWGSWSWWGSTMCLLFPCLHLLPCRGRALGRCSRVGGRPWSLRHPGKGPGRHLWTRSGQGILGRDSRHLWSLQTQGVRVSDIRLVSPAVPAPGLLFPTLRKRRGRRVILLGNRCELPLGGSHRSGETDSTVQ